MTVRKSILILGANGMLGSAVFRHFAQQHVHTVSGSVRASNAPDLLRGGARGTLIPGADVTDYGTLVRLFDEARPDVVINCVGLVKQLEHASDPLAAIPINAVLPHRLARLASAMDARVVHISTDCVFSGRQGLYTESDTPDAADVYGRTKLLGELEYANAITLRTSIIGPELATSQSLLSWFLSQSGTVRGFRRAIFSGLTTFEVARVIQDYVLPNESLRGLYHLAGDPIDKHSLLCLIADVYGKAISIEPSDELVIDRSLDATRFRMATGYEAPSWRTLIEQMHNLSKTHRPNT